MNILLKILLITIILISISCDDPDETKVFFVGDANFFFIDSVGIRDDYALVIYQFDTDKRNLIEGFNNLHIGFYDFKLGNYTKDVDFDLTITKGESSSPYYIDEVFNDLLITECPIYFNEPSGAESWEVNVFGKISGRDFSNSFFFDDVEPGIFIEKFEHNSEEYQFTLVEPFDGTTPTGVSNVEFAVHKKENLTWQAVENLTCKIIQTNGEITNPLGVLDPKLVENGRRGHYRGTINLINVGAWEIDVEIYLDNVLIFTFEKEFVSKV